MANQMNVHDFALRFVALRTEMSDQDKTDPILGRRSEGTEKSAQRLSDTRRARICDACDTFFDTMRDIAKKNRYVTRDVTHDLGIYTDEELADIDVYRSDPDYGNYVHADEDFEGVKQTMDRVKTIDPANPGLNDQAFDGFARFVQSLKHAGVMDAAHFGIEGDAEDPAAKNRTPGVDPISQEGYDAIKPVREKTKGFNIKGYDDNTLDLPQKAGAFGVTMDRSTRETGSEMVESLADLIENHPEAFAYSEAGEEKMYDKIDALGYNNTYSADQYEFAKAFIREVSTMTPQSVQKELHGMTRSQAVQKLVFRDEADDKFNDSLKHFQERTGEHAAAEIPGY